MKPATLISLVLIVISLALSGWALWSRSQEAKHAREASSEAWHKVICFSEQQVLASKKATPEQKRQALKFYNQILRLVDAQPCK